MVKTDLVRLDSLLPELSPRDRGSELVEHTVRQHVSLCFAALERRLLGTAEVLGAALGDRRLAVGCGVELTQAVAHALIDGLRDIPLVGDVRGDGYFLAIELVPGVDRGLFTDEQSAWLLRGYLSPRLYDAGLICRADDRGEPVITLSPPLIAGEEEFAFIESTLRTVLTDASREFAARERR